MSNTQFSIRIPIALLLALGISLLSNSYAEEGQSQPKTVIVVNDRTISQDLFAAYIKVNRRNGKVEADSAEKQRAILNEIVNLVLLSQEAEAEGVAQRPEVEALIAINQIMITAQAALDNLLRSAPITDEELRKAYDEQYANKELKEYKLRHIQVESEQEAKDIIHSLDQGESFESLAKDHSTDGSAGSGGDLGWVGAEQLPPGFRQAVKEMSDGEFVRKPLQSDSGWHVLKVDKSRKLPAPSFEQKRDSLLLAIRQQRVADKINQLRETAKIETTQQ